MSVFERRRLPTEVILVCVRWYCKYGISYRDLAEMMQERGVAVDHTTIFRWVQRYAPEIEKRARWYQGYRSPSWRVDESDARVGGAWNYLFRAVDKTGRLIDFMLSERRNTSAAHRVLGKALNTTRDWPPRHCQRMARPVCKGFLRARLISLRQRIRSRSTAPAKMEIRASRAS